MSRWTDEELRELIALWPTNSALQIAKRLRRPRSGICGKVGRLRQAGVSLAKGFTKLLAGDPSKRPVPRRDARYCHPATCSPCNPAV